MVSWHADGSVSGFTLVGNTTNVLEDALPGLTRDVIHLATAGTVDANGITRQQYDIAGANYRRTIDGVARIRFSTTEYNAAVAASRIAGATMVIAVSNNFAPGVKPTPAEILAASTKAMYHSYNPSTVANANVVIEIPGGKPPPNTKVWVLVYPSTFPPGSTPSVANDIPVGILNTAGRAVSVWSNRTPLAPVITKPGSDAVFGAGSEFDLTFVPQDPDKFLGSKAGAYQDLAGVQVQYAPRPTVSDPTPTWIDLPIATIDAGPVFGDEPLVPGAGWYIQQSIHNDPSSDVNNGALYFLLDNTMKVRAGGPVDKMSPGAGILPEGDWQIRIRTFDYGHAYPRWKRPLNSADGDYTPSTYAADNTSPWSTPVRVSVSVQVPPPVPVSPIANVAVPEDVPVTLRWKYRNTYTPPFGQKERTVQIRKVGDPDWTTVVSGNGTDPFYALDSAPPVVPDPPTQYLGNTAPIPYVDPPQHSIGPGGVFPFRRVLYAHTLSETNDAPNGTDSGSSAERFYRIDPTQTGTLVIDTALSTQPNVGTWSGSGGRTVDVSIDSGALVASSSASAGRDQLVINVTVGTPVLFRVVYSNTAGGDVIDMRVRIGDYNASIGSLWDPWANIPGIGFENGSKDGWLTTSANGIVVDNNAGAAHTGDKYLLLTNTDSFSPTVYQFVDLDPGDEFFDVDLWTSPGNSTTTLVQVTFTDSAHSEVLGTHAKAAAAGSGYKRVSFRDLVRPAGATVMFVQMTIIRGDGLPPVNDWRLDDVSILGGPVPPSDPIPTWSAFPLEATTQYEWRVKVVDTSRTASVYSSIARFWVVPAPDSGPVIPLPSETIEGATLGCGTHRVLVFRRGGTRFVGELTQLDQVEWARLRDDISDAKIVVSGWNIDCGNLLARLQTWAYEVVIFRDNGYSMDRVWEGPITLLTYENDKVTIHAKDVLVWTKRRIIKQLMNDSGTSDTAGDTVVQRGTRIMQNVFAPDDPNILAYLTPLDQPDDAKQYRNLPAYSRYAYEEVDDMAANSGLDYCAVGRRILLWGTKHRIGTLPEFKDENLGSSPIVSEYGMSMANVYSVSDGNGIHGEAYRLNDDGEDPSYGLVEMLSSSWASESQEEVGTYTQEGIETIIESFEGFAERSIASKYPPPVVVRVPDNTTLNPNTVISIQHLVPGVVIPLRSVGTLRTVASNQKLDSLKVIESRGAETISVVLSPFSRDDDDAGEGGEE